MRCTIATLTFFSFASLVLAAPLPDGGSAYTGAGAQAICGTNSQTNNQGGLANGLSGLDVAGGNAGNGGKATSGSAFGGEGGRK